jgi:hypothetical protein
MLNPIHQMVSMNLGSMLSAHLYDRLMVAGVSPSGIGHLEQAELNSDLTTARDFGQGILGPPSHCGHGRSADRGVRISRDLMIKNGIYAELFRMQASAYAE